MLYMETFTINIPQMLAYIPYMDPMGNENNHYCTVIYSTHHHHHPRHHTTGQKSPLMTRASCSLNLLKHFTWRRFSDPHSSQVRCLSLCCQSTLGKGTGE